MVFSIAEFESKVENFLTQCTLVAGGGTFQKISFVRFQWSSFDAVPTIFATESFFYSFFNSEAKGLIKKNRLTYDHRRRLAKQRLNLRELFRTLT